MLEKPFVNILGTLPPDMLSELVGDGGRDDGSLERLILCFPTSVPDQKWSEKVIPESAERNWQTAVERFLALEGNVVVGLSTDAKQIWERWFNDHTVELQDPSLLPTLQGTWAKLRGTCARTALILHQLRRVCGETKSNDIDHESMKRAIRLIDYLKSQAVWIHRRVFGRLGGLSSDAEAVLIWVRKHGFREFSRKTLWEHLRRRFGRQGTMDEALKELEKRELIRKCLVRHGGRGQKPSPKFEVHPGLFPITRCSQNSRNS
jgi:hypothetical protein